VFEATFSRAVALAPENKGLAFLTPGHPLVRAVLQRVRARLYEDNPQDRVTVRAIADGQPGWLFTHIGRIMTTDGRLLEEPLIPVFVPAHSDGAPGPASQDATADLKKLRSRPAPANGHDPIPVARQLLQPRFTEAGIVAATEANRRLVVRTEQLRAQLAGEVQHLAGELERWHAAELADAEHRLADHLGDGFFQLGLFTDLGHSTFRTLQEAQAAINREFDRRRQLLADGYRVADAGAAEPVGCVLLVEAS
jgi:hypothetical protein